VVTDSALAVLWHVDRKTIAYVPIHECEWGSREFSLQAEPDDPTDAFLDSLRGDAATLIVAYRNNVAICRVQDVTHISEFRCPSLEACGSSRAVGLRAADGNGIPGY